MHAPLFSTVTLLAELIISAIIYYALYLGFKKNKFPTLPVALALVYEIIFNISYMATQAHNHVHSAKAEPVYVILLAIIHGILSLIMFIALVVFFIFAYTRYKKGSNYFAAHKILTFTFIIFWTFSICSGVLLYFLTYIF